MNKILFYILIILAAVPVFSNAQTVPDIKYTLLEPLPCIDGTNGKETCGNNAPAEKEISLNGYIGYVFKFAIALAAFLAMIQIIWGGFSWMLSETPFKISNAKERIQNAIIGLVMVLASYLILATIDPRLVEINTTIEPIKVDTSDLAKLETQLYQDFKNLDAEGKIKTQENNNEIKSLETANKDIQAKLERKEITGYDAAVQTAINNDKIKDKQASNIEEVAKRSSGIALDQIYADIYTDDPKTWEVSTESGALLNPAVEQGIKDSAKAMEMKYEQQIKELDSLQSFERSGRLKVEKTYYTEQIPKEVELKREILNFEVGADNKLTELKTKYVEELNNAQKGIDFSAESDGDPHVFLMEEKMLKLRIERINEAILKKDK